MRAKEWFEKDEGAEIASVQLIITYKVDDGESVDLVQSDQSAWNAIEHFASDYARSVIPEEIKESAINDETESYKQGHRHCREETICNIEGKEMNYEI